MSNFAKLNGVFLSQLSASVEMIRCIHCPRCIIDSSGAYFTASEFTDCIIAPLCQIWKERTKSIWYDRDLCGIMATGEIFSFSGRFFFRSPYLITLAYMLSTLSILSQCSDFIASSAPAEVYGPLHSAVSM